MRRDFIFLLLMQGTRVAGSIPAGCIFCVSIPTRLMRRDFIFLLRMQGTRVTGSIPAGCIFQIFEGFDHNGRIRRSAHSRRFCAIQQDSKSRESYKRDHLTIGGQAQRPAPTKGLIVRLGPTHQHLKRLLHQPCLRERHKTKLLIDRTHRGILFSIVRDNLRSPAALCIVDRMML